MVVPNISDTVDFTKFPKFELKEVIDGDIIVYQDTPVIVKREEKLKFIDVESRIDLLEDTTSVTPEMQFYILGFQDGEVFELLEV